jgi:DNA end-binding protein Ku
MRAIWTGAISFGLVNIPVKLYSAVEASRIDLDMLDKKDLSPIKYKRVSANTDKEVPYEDIVKGYKYGDRYVLVEQEDFEKVSPEKTKTIDIVDFVDEKEIDSSYYEKPYYLEPDKTAGKSYILLREALKQSGKVGIAIFIIRNRQRIGVIKPSGDMIILNQIRYADEIRSPEELNIPTAKVRDKEVEMALHLIEQLNSDFNPGQYKDEYTEKLLEIIEKKAQGKPIRTKKAKEPKPTESNELINLLKASLKKRKEERTRTASKTKAKK